MIKQETYENGFIHTFSDQEGYGIKNTVTGDIFEDAVDDPTWGCEYEEIELTKPEHEDE